MKKRECVSDFQVFRLLRIILGNSNFSRAMEIFSGTSQLYFQYRVNVKILN